MQEGKGRRARRVIAGGALIGGVALLTASLAFAASAQAQGGPPGNNGTVKIDGVDFDDHPNNQPHPGCVFQIDFYGYDEGDYTADYAVELRPPTTGGLLIDGALDIGEDAAGGGTDLDGSVTLDLASELAASGVDPHPIQGYHVRLTVNAEGSQGADKKHKMFWIECVEVEPTTTPTSTPTSTPTVEPTVVETEGPEVLGVRFRRLPTTGVDAGTIAITGGLMIIVGLGLRATRREEAEATE